MCVTLRNHAYSNILKILKPKTKKKKPDKKSVFFHISAQNIDCGYSLEPPRHINYGHSLEPPQHIDCGYSLEPPRHIDCGYSLEPPR